MTENIRSQTAAVIPAYQDEKHIGDIARRTRERLDHVLVVDDGSTDQTEQRAREAGAEVIVHAQNQGKGEAIKTGLAHWLGAANPSSSGQDRQITWVILLDSDGQHLPEEIDRFLLAAASVTRPTFFIGNRMDDVARMPFVRRVVNRYMSSQISRVCGQKIPDTQCGYRMLHREIIPDMLGGGHRFDYETEALIIASRKGYRIESVPITTVYTDQVSKIHPGRDSLRFFKMMRRYSDSQLALLCKNILASSRKVTNARGQATVRVIVAFNVRSWRSTATLLNYGFLAGRGFELLRISDSGVSVVGLPLKMMRFGFWASVSTSSLAYVVTTFRFKRVTCSCFNCS